MCDDATGSDNRSFANSNTAVYNRTKPDPHVVAYDNLPISESDREIFVPY